MESLDAGWVCSADDFFVNDDGVYVYDVKKIRKAHEWAQNKALLMLEQELSPVVVDNTNTQAWECRAYVEPAVERGYAIEILSPQTEWRNDPVELARRNRHGVPEAAIRKMMQRWEDDVTVESIMAAKPPVWMRPPSSSSSADAAADKLAQMTLEKK